MPPGPSFSQWRLIIDASASRGLNDRGRNLVVDWDVDAIVRTSTMLVVHSTESASNSTEDVVGISISHLANTHFEQLASIYSHALNNYL